MLRHHCFSFRVAAIAAVAVASTSANAFNFTYFQSSDMGSGTLGGFINDPNAWSLGVTPDVTSDLRIPTALNQTTYQYDPQTLYLSDVNGVGGGNYNVGTLWVESGNLFTIARYGSGDYGALIVGTTSSEASNSYVYNQLGDVSLQANLIVLGHSSIDGSLAVVGGVSYLTDTADVGDYSWGLDDTSLNIASGGTATVTGALTVNEFCASPIGVSIDGTAGGSAPTTLNAGTLNAWFYNGTALKATGAAATANIGSATLWQFSGTALDAEQGGQINVNNPVALWSNCSGTVFNAASGGQIIAGGYHPNGNKFTGQVAVVSDPGSLVHVGDIYDWDAHVVGDAPVFQASNDGRLEIGDIQGLSTGAGTVLDARTGASIAIGSVQLQSSSAPTLIHLDNSASLTGVSFESGSNVPTSIYVLNGSTMALTGELHVWSNSDIALFLTGASTLSAYQIDLNTDGAVTLNISDDSTLSVATWLNINAGAPSSIEITPTTTWLNGPDTQMGLSFSGAAGTQAATFTIDPGATIHRAKVSLSEANVQIGGTTGVPVVLDGFEIWLGNNSNAVLDNVIWHPHPEEWGFYGSEITVSGSTSSQATLNNTFMVQGWLAVANQPSSVGALTIDSGCEVNSGGIQVGTQLFGSGGTGVLNIQNAANVNVEGYVSIGAIKDVDSNGNTNTKGLGGVGTLNVTNSSTLVIGSYINEDGTWQTMQQPISVTLGSGSSLNVDATSSVYIGTASHPSDLIQKLGVVSVGPWGWLNGDGSINGANIADATGVTVENDGGKIQPGLSPGTLTINGTYIQNAGDLVIDIAGAQDGQYGRLTATSGFQFKGGHIVIELIGNGYTGSDLAGQSLAFLTGGSIDWTGFDFTSGLVNDTGLSFTLNPNGTITSAAAVPEPFSMAALVVGLAGFASRRRREKRQIH